LLSLATACNSKGPPQDLQAVIEQAATDNHVCVAALATLKGRAVEEVYEVSGCDRAPRTASPTVFEAASLGKPVFGYGVLKWAREGHLDLDAPLATYLKQGYVHVQNPFDMDDPVRTDRVDPSALQHVTARRLLTHTAGLPNWSNEPLVFEPDAGTVWRYSGEGYVLLQSAVEAISGVRLDEFMRTQVFEPLGMSDSDFVWNPRWTEHLAPGMSSSGDQLPLKHYRDPISASTLYTTAGDFAKFLSAVLRDEELMRATLAMPVSVDPSLNLEWGLGWGVENMPQGERLIWHWGSNPGYRAFVMASVKSGDGLVLLTNNDNGLALAEPAVDAVLPGDHRIFKLYMLRDGLSFVACRSLNLCF
jgi:CubicO group peptidase (beta-lactamase class C family)